MTENFSVLIEKIDIEDRLRQIDQAALPVIVSSFREIGQKTPIEVVAKPDGRWRLVAGLHRLQAAKEFPMKPSDLNVVCAVFNPIRWRSRKDLYLDFEQHMLDSGVSLTVVECALGGRAFELSERPHVNVVQVRAKTLAWNKENLINIGIQRLPDQAQRIAWIDADVEFRGETMAGYQPVRGRGVMIMPAGRFNRLVAAVGAIKGDEQLRLLQRG